MVEWLAAVPDAEVQNIVLGVVQALVDLHVSLIGDWVINSSSMALINQREQAFHALLTGNLMLYEGISRLLSTEKIFAILESKSLVNCPSLCAVRLNLLPQFIPLREQLLCSQSHNIFQALGGLLDHRAKL
jgi:hypothetical protein